MKTQPLLLVGLLLSAAVLRAQPSAPPSAPPPSSATYTTTDSAAAATSADNAPPASDAPQRTSEQLEQLLGPIALYPDALIALILPAATNASDVVLASRFLAANSDAAQIDAQPWDESVKSLSRYPEVVKWMDDNLEWTKQVGEAFATQPTDVMNAMQHLRAEARANGSLVDTPQQKVVMQDAAISILPAQADVIYVPRYDPEIVFVDSPRSYGYSYISFGAAYPVGSWLSFDCDWQQHRIWIDRRFSDGRNHRDLRRPVVYPVGPSFASNPNFRPWRPSPNFAHSRAPDPQWRNRPIVRPAPLPGAPLRPGNGARPDSNHWWAGNPNAPRTPPADGRNHGSGRRRSDVSAPSGVNPPVAPVASAPAPGMIQPRNVAPGAPAAPAPGFTNPSANNPTERSIGRRDRPEGDSPGRAINPNFRAGAFERPRSQPAPGLPEVRSAPATRNAAVLPAPAPAINPVNAPAARGPAPSAPANNSPDSANDNRGRGGDHSGGARDR
jgi:hypothetical protein